MRAGRVVGEGLSFLHLGPISPLWVHGQRALLGIVHRTNDTSMSYHIAKKLVFNKIRSALGLDHCHYCISGAGPLRPETSEFFLSLDIPIGEMYGMTESSGPHTVSNQGNYRILRYRPPRQVPPSPPPVLQQHRVGGERWEGGWGSGLR